MIQQPILNDLCIAIVDCEHKTAPIVPVGIPSIRTSNIKNGRIDFENANRVSPETYAEWTQRMEPQPGDLVLAREAPVGEVGLIPPGQRACLGQRTVLIRPTPELLDSRYLLYLLLTPEMRHEMGVRASGSTVAHLNMSDIRQLELPEVPPLDEQRAIASVLGSLDDKIELNRRMNRTLEGMASSIFKAWFVDFEPVRAKAAGAAAFPGMPQPVFDALPATFTDSELGPIPEGWEVRRLPDIIEINPKRSLRRGEPAPHLDMKNMPTQGHAPEAWGERVFGSGMKFTNGDTLVARITPCLENGKTAFVDFLAAGAVGWGSTEYIVLRPKPPLPEVFAYCLARTGDFRDFAIQNMTGTSGRQRVPATALEHFSLVRPDEMLAKAFGGIVEPLFTLIRSNMDESRSLAEARDALLPKLLSGEVRVTERKTAETVA